MNNNYEEINKYNEEIEKFDTEQAEKLLRNLRILGDLNKIQVPEPNTAGMKTISFNSWIEWYYDYIEYYGGNGIEHDIITIFTNINSNLRLMVNRAEEGFRMLLNTLERKNRTIEYLNTTIARQIEIIDKQNQELIKKSISVPIADQTTVPAIVPTVVEPKEEPQEKPKYQRGMKLGV